jgi:hypothetical protein
MNKTQKDPQPLTVAGLFRKVASETLAVDVEGDTLTMTRFEALARVIQEHAFNGNSSAVRLLVQMWKKFPRKAEPDHVTYVIYPEDERL